MVCFCFFVGGGVYFLIQAKLWVTVPFLFTLATIAVLAPSLAAITHWLAPLPPNPIKNLLPWIVSPGLGCLGVKLKHTLEVWLRMALNESKYSSLMRYFNDSNTNHIRPIHTVDTANWPLTGLSKSSKMRDSSKTPPSTLSSPLPSASEMPLLPVPFPFNFP